MTVIAVKFTNNRNKYVNNSKDSNNDDNEKT